MYLVKITNDKEENSCVLNNKELISLLEENGITETTGSSVQHENGWTEYQVDINYSIWVIPYTV